MTADLHTTNLKNTKGRKHIETLVSAELDTLMTADLETLMSVDLDILGTAGPGNTNDSGLRCTMDSRPQTLVKAALGTLGTEGIKTLMTANCISYGQLTSSTGDSKPGYTKDTDLVTLWYTLIGYTIGYTMDSRPQTLGTADLVTLMRADLDELMDSRPQTLVTVDLDTLGTEDMETLNKGSENTHDSRPGNSSGR